MTTGPENIPVIYRFGNFEVHPQAGELLRKGVRVKVQEQPFQLLNLLLENAGEIVSRENVRQRLWPGNTFVEFDASLSVAVGKLRDALGDVADNPRFIETIPRKGYRFVAPVERHAPPKVAGGRAVLGEHAETSSPVAATVETRSAAGWSVSVKRALAICVLALALVGAFVFRAFHQHPAGTAEARTSPAAVQVRRSVAVLGFRNLPGRKDDDWLSQAFAEMLSTELAAGGSVRLVSDEDVARAKRELLLENEDTLSKTTLERLHGNPGADVVLVGSYTPLPGKEHERIRLDLRLQDTDNGEIIAEDAVLGSREDLFEMATRAGEHLRKSLGIGGLSADSENAIRASLPANQEAVRLYTAGKAKLWDFDFVAARDLLTKAVSADPNFPLAHSALADAWWDLGYVAKAKVEGQRAIELSGHLPVEEQLRIKGSYLGANGEWLKAIEIYRSLFLLHPDNLDYGLRLAGAQFHAKPPDALQTLKTLRQLPDPAGSDPRIDLIEAAAQVNQDLPAAQAAAKRAIAKGKALGSPMVVAHGYGFLCQQGSSTGIGLEETVSNCENGRQTAASFGDHYDEARTLSDMAGVYYQRGNLARAETMWREADKVFRQVGDMSVLAVTENNIGEVLLLEGKLGESQTLLMQALAGYRASDDQDGQSLVLSDLGEIALLRAELGKAEKNYQQAKIVAAAIDDRSALGFVLHGMGELYLDRGELSAARASYEEALTVRTQMGEKQAAAQTQMALARLAIEEGHPGEYAAVLRKCREQFHKEGQTDDEITAAVTLAEVLLAQGQTDEATKEIAGVADLAQKSLNRLVRLRYSLLAAKTQLAAGAGEMARKELERVAAEARLAEFLNVEWEARLALAAWQKQSGHGKQAQELLAAVQREAHSKNFALVARKAAAARTIGH